MSLVTKIKDFMGFEFCKHPNSRLYLGFGISSSLLSWSLFPDFKYLDLICYGTLALGVIKSSIEKSKELIKDDEKYWSKAFEDTDFLEWKMNASDEEIINEWTNYLKAIKKDI